MQTWWLSCHKFTVMVTIDNENKIVKAAPIVRRFIGQPSSNLRDWMTKIGGYKAERLL